MQLYKFVLSTYNSTKITRTVLEAEEKQKTYSIFDGRWTSRVNKMDIGVAIGLRGDTVILIEDDIKKAKEIFTEDLKRKISDEKKSIEAKIKSGNERISELEKTIDEIEEIKESEVIDYGK